MLVRHGGSIHETVQNRPISTFHLFRSDYEPDTLGFFYLLASENYIDFNASFGPQSFSAVQTALRTKTHATKALKFLRQHGVNLNRIQENGQTLLHLAADIARDPEVLEYLCSINGLEDINRQDKWGRTPLHYSVMSEYNGHCAIPFQKIRYLLSQGADHTIKGGGTPCSFGKEKHPDLTPLEFLASIRPSLESEFVSAIMDHARSAPPRFEEEIFVDALEIQPPT